MDVLVSTIEKNHLRGSYGIIVFKAAVMLHNLVQIAGDN